jgi:hypothetical protein
VNSGMTQIQFGRGRVVRSRLAKHLASRSYFYKRIGMPAQDYGRRPAINLTIRNRQPAFAPSAESLTSTEVAGYLTQVPLRFGARVPH